MSTESQTQDTSAREREDQLLFSLAERLNNVQTRKVLLESVDVLLKMLERRFGAQTVAEPKSLIITTLERLDPAAAPEVVKNTGQRCVDAVRRLIPKPQRKQETDISYMLPPHLAHLLSRLEYDIPQPPQAEGNFSSFDDLCEAAILARLDKVLVFFQRHNPSLARTLPPPFLNSPEFAEKLREAVKRFIVPAIRESRQLRMQASNFNWQEATTESFWDHMNSQMCDKLQQAWQSGWDELKLVETQKRDGTKVMQVKADTKVLRDMLSSSTPEGYDLPRIGNKEISVFISLMDPYNDWWEQLSKIWQSCHDLYEQEKDPRVFQDRAREGALRDNLLTVFRKVPDQWADFLLLTCHRVFPRINCFFMEKFATNFGRDDREREKYLPYLMRYLMQVRGRPDVRECEAMEEEAWAAQEQELRKFLKGLGDNPATSKQ